MIAHSCDTEKLGGNNPLHTAANDQSPWGSTMTAAPPIMNKTIDATGRSSRSQQRRRHEMFEDPDFYDMQGVNIPR